MHMHWTILIEIENIIFDLFWDWHARRLRHAESAQALELERRARRQDYRALLPGLKEPLWLAYRAFMPRCRTLIHIDMNMVSPITKSLRYDGLMIRCIALVLVAALIVFLLAIYTQSPRTDRAWDDEFSRVTTAYAEGDSIVLTNVRDWTYSGPFAVAEKQWIDTLAVNPDDITRTWFLLDQFSTHEGVGHTFLSFERKDGGAVSFSIEARREEGETYSVLGGVLNAYELQYLWGTERDFVPLRTVYLEHSVRMYPLTLSKEESQALFRALTEETNQLAQKPRFYHTLLANCTNMLAKIVNEHYPGRLPYDIAWNLTGYADRYLMEQGLIERTGSNEETRHAADLTPHREDIQAAASMSPEAFSAFVRSLLVHVQSDGV